MKSWFRKNPTIGWLFVICGLVALAEIGLIYERWAEGRAQMAKAQQRLQEYEAMRDVVPPPNPETVAVIEADLARAQQALKVMEAELKGRAATVEKIQTAKAPAARTDAYFDLATFVEKTRELAKKNEVEVRPEASRFGFSQFANEGPELERIEPVFRQRLVAQYLVEALLEAKPRTLLSVKREAPLTKAEREARDAALVAVANGGQPATEPPPEGAPPADTPPEGPDFFAMPAASTVRAPEQVATMGFRFVFTGQTAALRQFLSRLASFELPVLVRDVEVEMASTEDTAPNTAQVDDAAAAATTADNAAAPASVVLSLEPDAAKPAPKKPSARASTVAPIVAKPYSKFTVTVEYIELVTPPAAPGDAPPPAPPAND